MARPLVDELRNQIRGMAGALLVMGVTFPYTMETWWLGWTLPWPYIIAFALVGLGIVVAATRIVGFHESEPRGEETPLWFDVFEASETILQSFVAAYTLLLVLGIVTLSTSIDIVVRLGMLLIPPLAFGAALANRVFGGASQNQGQQELVFPRNIAIFSAGALFVSGTIAPTQELELIAVHMDWLRYLVLMALSLVMIYLLLYELGFKDQQARVRDRLWPQVGMATVVYAVAAGISVFLLAGFGHFIAVPLSVAVQETIVLAFPASLGAAAAEVVV
ncbi:MAG: DUF2391 family protein [Haloarculaceae archaeon]